MSKLAIEPLRFCTRRPKNAESGSALVGTMVVLVGLLGLVCTAGTMSALEVKESRRAVESVQSKYLAEAGIERGLGFLAQAIKNTTVHDPLRGLTGLFAAGNTITPFIAEPVMNGTMRTGAYTVSLTSLEQTSTSITIAIDASGYLPDAPSALPAGKQVGAWHALRSTVRYSLAPSKVFDYAYFLNNWGWFYGSSIYGNGNVRSNGQFDAAGYAPVVTGEPMYDKVAYSGGVASLSGYHDDNNDGLQDGNDGGIYSGWDIVGAQNVRGNGGLASNQHDFQDMIQMPNLADLSRYEQSAKDLHSTITIGGTVVTDAVYGDAVGEKQNLYLVGTLANPIVLNGPVVVRGSVVISGYVTGQGSIYSGGNVYCPNSINYVNKPTTPRPANTTQAATEAWLSANWNKDFLGLFAKESVVVGDPFDSTWRYYVSSWMNDSLNQSAEDAGSDGMPNTRAGRDGILGTADDDVLEGDGVFTIEHYTASDLALGLIPPGKSVGDPIPGTGEDIDGDGVYDARTTLADVTPSLPMTTSGWGGNLPPAGLNSASDFRSIANMRASNFDATFYTNHSFCWVVLGGTSATINGALVSRNENIIYGTPSLQFNHDSRLLGGSSGLASKMLPIEVQPVEMLRWAQLDRDPNRYVVTP